jgi:hypothetical protein
MASIVSSGLQAVSAACTGAALGAVGTYQVYHAVWKSRDHVAERSSLYDVKPDPTGREVSGRARAIPDTRVRGVRAS